MYLKDKKKLKILLICLVILVVIISIVLVVYNTNKNNVKNVDMASLDIEMATEGNFNNNRMLDITKQEASEIFGINPDYIEEVIGKTPLLNISSSMYIVVKAKKDNVQDVKKCLENYVVKYEQEWASYLEDQYELVKNRELGNKGDYVYLIICDEPDKLVKLIK